MVVRKKKLYAKETMCISCTSSSICNSCKEVFATSDYVLDPTSDAGNEDDEVREPIQDPDDYGQSNVEVDNDESDDEIASSDNINVGTIVWGKQGRIW